MVEPRRPASQPARTHVRRPGAEEPIAVPTPDGFEVREGDVLVVAYPEVTLPLRVQYAMVRVGGCSYSRVLRDGDDVNEQFGKISAWLAAQVEADARRKIAAYTDELEASGPRRG